MMAVGAMLLWNSSQMEVSAYDAWKSSILYYTIL